MRLLRGSIVLVLLTGLFGAFVGTAVASSTYRVQVDAAAPAGEPWDFLRFFPRSIKVHRNDIVNLAWAGMGAPHTATVVPAADGEAWRGPNQAPGGPYELAIPDTAVGGDDGEPIINPAVAFPSSPGCGGAGTHCDFDGSSVLNSGMLFSNPEDQPSFRVRMAAPVGGYAFVCLLHPGMSIPVRVVTGATPIPDPATVDRRAARQVAEATEVDGEAADAQAQTVVPQPLADGTTRYQLYAGGFSNGVTANEFLDEPLAVRVGDRLRFNATGEIHTVTFPKSAINRVPFIVTQCEVIGPDTPAASPFDCADPSRFEIALNPKALAPTASPGLRDPHKFINSGLIVGPVHHTFFAREPGTYRFICLVHGPMMSSTIEVEA